ncbi:MAG: hypothetical protein L6R38_003107 [Xanthoria sp. 2 TBL-2021]|nr:MAG: hypothetical protein L6R38_003107 [Xanthoria sp. 2 TBL-2021]
MHLSTILSLALAVSPLAVLARGNLGYAIGARKPDSSCKSTTDYEADFDALNSKGGLGGVKRVRTYAVVDNAFPENLCQVASAILPAAKAKGFQVILGLSADTKAAYDSEKATLATVLTSEYASTVYALTVGSESLYREVDACELLPRIVDARSTFGNIVKRVGTVDSWNKFADGTADPIITGNCDGKASVPGITFLLVNAFGYWQGQDINNATATYLDDLQQAIGHIQDLAGLNAVEIMNGETGWPGDGGSDHYSAVASTKNEERFFTTGVCTMLALGVDVFYFEAFDESQKPLSKADTGELRDETHWGAFYDNRTPKFSLSCPTFG